MFPAKNAIINVSVAKRYALATRQIRDIAEPAWLLSLGDDRDGGSEEEW
jgi:hypothetical protein